MTAHLTDEEIHDLVDARLDRGAASARLSHVEVCSACREATNRISAVISAASELRRPALPVRDLWPAVSGRTVQANRIRGPWLFTLILAVVVIAGTSLWLERTRPWEPIATQVISEPDYRASDGEIQRILATLHESGSDATKRRELDRLAASVFRSLSPQVREGFFDAVASIQSDGEKRKLLMFLTEYAADTLAAAGLIVAARSIGSSSQKSEVLAALAAAPSMANPALRLRFLDAVETITSERDRAAARSALLTR